VLEKPILLPIRHDSNDVGQLCEIPRLPGGVAAGHDDAGGRIVASDAADRLAGALIGGGRHRAGVHDHQVSAGWSRLDRAAAPQVLLDAQ
jgi:hypothetical protein